MDAIDTEAEVLLPRSQWSRRGFVMTSLITGFALSLRPVSAEAINTDANGLDVGEVKVPVRRHDPGLSAMPDKGGPFPTVLVIQEALGVHEHIKDFCRRLAKPGYFAIAPELFARQGNAAAINRPTGGTRQVSFGRQPKFPPKKQCPTSTPPLCSPKRPARLTPQSWRSPAAAGAGLRPGCTPRIIRSEGGGRVVRGRPQDHRHCTRRTRAISPATLKCPVLALYGGQDQGIPKETIESARQLQGGRQDLRVQGLSRRAARLQRRLPAELPRRRRQGRLDPMLAWFKDHGVG